MRSKVFFEKLGYMVVECHSTKPQPAKMIEVKGTRLTIQKKRWLITIPKKTLHRPCTPCKEPFVIQQTAVHILKAITRAAHEVTLRDLIETTIARPSDLLWLTRMQLGTFGRNKRGQIISYKPNRDKYSDERLLLLSNTIANGNCYASHCPLAHKCSHYVNS